MVRRHLAVTVATLALACTAGHLAIGQDVQQITGSEEIIFKNGFQGYEEFLNAVLKTRRLEEKEYVQRVVRLVEEKKLPLTLVDSCWTWVRDKRPDCGYPFVYFQQILHLRAERVGLTVPPFDYRIYNRR